MPSLGSVGIMASNRMQLQNMCKKRGHGSFKEYAQRWRTWQLKWHLNDEKTMTMIVDTLPVFYYGKWWATHLQSFEDLVFAIERIDAGLKKGKFSHPAWTNEKTGANEEGENEG